MGGWRREACRVWVIWARIEEKYLVHNIIKVQISCNGGKGKPFDQIHHVQPLGLAQQLVIEHDWMTDHVRREIDPWRHFGVEGHRSNHTRPQHPLG